MDELTQRRERAVSAPTASSRRAMAGEPGGRAGGDDGTAESREQRPPLWRWFSTQTAHSDPAKATAARAVRERWDLAVTRFGKIDRALSSEDSEHLPAFRALIDEYRLAYVPDDVDGSFARETGADSLLVPFAPEKCDQCRRDAVPGTGKCGRHGGQWISVQDLEALSRRIRDRLWTQSESALRVLQDLMDNGRSEQVRMMAATAILDRAGVGPHMTIKHGVAGPTEQDAAAAKLMERLDMLGDNVLGRAALLAKIESHGADDGIEDAEVVPEPEVVKR